MEAELIVRIVREDAGMVELISNYGPGLGIVLRLDAVPKELLAKFKKGQRWDLDLTLIE